MGKSKVVLVQNPNIHNAVKLALDELGSDLDGIVDNGPILIKPNILTQEFRNEGLTNTNPAVCEAIAKYFLQNKTKSILIGEGTTNARDGEPDTIKAMRNNFFLSPERAGLWEPIDFNLDEDGCWFPIYSPGLDFNVELSIAKSALDYPVISVAKLKTHDVLGVTLSLKNMMGTICRARNAQSQEIIQEKTLVKAFMHGYGPKQPPKLTREQNLGSSKVALATNLVRLAHSIKPALSIIEVFPGMEGNGPTRGTPVRTNLLIASYDSLACDAVAARLAGFDLADFQYLQRLNELEFGQANMEKIELIVKGDVDINSVPPFRPHELYKNAKFKKGEKLLLREQTAFFHASKRERDVKQT